MKISHNTTACIVLAAVLSTAPGMVPSGFSGDISLLEKTGNAFAAVAKDATPAVVYIRVEKSIELQGRQHYYNDPLDFFGDDFLRRFFGGRSPHHLERNPRRFRQAAAGSGFIISKDGYILTNSHVVGDAENILVRLSDGREFTGSLVGSDPESEVAVLKIEADNLPWLELGNSDEIQVGEWVIAIGNPFEFFAGSVTVGVVSAKGRSNLRPTEDMEYQDFIQTDAAINPGNSGGPLLNIHGKVIGINTAIYSNTGGFMGLGFAIPINMARLIKDQLIASGRVERGYLGINIQKMTDKLALALGVEQADGILIAGVMEGSAAEEAGLRAEDIILELNGKPIKSVSSFKNSIASNPPGTKVRLSILRKGEKRIISAVTGTMDAPETISTGILEKLGISVEDLTGRIANRLGYWRDSGVVVTEVRRGSPAAEAGIAPGHLIKAVNRIHVENVEGLHRALQDTAEHETFLLLVRTEDNIYYVTISLDE